MFQEEVLIVSGLPRSGTSLMMQFLDAAGIPILHDALREPDSNNPQGYYEYTPVRRLREDTSWMPQAVGKAVKIVAPLLPFLPNGYTYRIVFMERQLEEVARSQQSMLGRIGKAGGGLDEAEWVTQYGRLLEQVFAHIEAKGYPLLTIPHRDCVQAPENVAEVLGSFIGTIIEPETLTRVVQPELYRERA